jgi:hypothetical protein
MRRKEIYPNDFINLLTSGKILFQIILDRIKHLLAFPLLFPAIDGIALRNSDGRKRKNNLLFEA